MYLRSNKKHNAIRNEDGITSRGSRNSDKRKDRLGGTEKVSRKREEYKEYTPLKKLISAILKDIEDKPIFSPPKRLKAPPKKEVILNAVGIMMTMGMKRRTIGLQRIL